MESGYYPLGAEHDPNAPYNQVDLPEMEFKVTATFSVDKEVTVRTSDYIAEEDWDDDMGKYESIDTSDTNWIAAYQEQHESIEDLLCAFKELLDEHITTMINDMQCHIEIDKVRLKRFQYLKSECEGWVTHDFEVVE